MKKLILSLLVVFSILVSIVSANDMFIEPTVLDFGEVGWGDEGSKTFRITNNGSADLTNVAITTNAALYNVTISPTSFNLTQGSQQDITVEVLHENDEDGTTGNKSVGDIQITSVEHTPADIPMYFVAPNRLQISDLDVKVGGASDANLDNESKIDESANPGQEVVFTVELENTFDSDDEENEFEDVKIEITIKDIDDGDDIDDNVERFEISAGDKKSKTLTFDVPDIVEAKTYDVEIKVEADNADTNEDYLMVWEVYVEVEKKSHDIRIKSYSLIPAELECGTRDATASIEILNMGEKDEDEVAIEIKNSDLNINEKLSGINMGKDNDNSAKTTKEIDFTIAEEFAVGGSYVLTVNAYYDNDKLDDQEALEFEIKSCGTTVTPDPEPEPEVETTEPEVEIEETAEVTEDSTAPSPAINIEGAMPGINVGKSTKGISQSPLFIPIIGLVAIVVLISLASIIIVIKKK